MQSQAPESRSQIIEAARAVLATRQRTVWDARRLLAPVVGQVVSLVIDDGQHVSVRRFGVYQDVIRSPDLGFAIKVKGLLPVGGRAERSLPRYRVLRRRMNTIPVSVLRPPVDSRLAFLLSAPESWPLPEPWVECACGALAAGRFCDSCGTKVGNSTGHPGEGFVAEQGILRAHLLGYEHSCGAVVAPWSRYCSKCGGVGERGSGAIVGGPSCYRV